MQSSKKIKVYELARSLRIKEKKFLTILETLQIKFSSKFSPIDNNDVERISTWCEQNPESLKNDKSTGNHSTLIRRRRRKIKEETP